MRKLGIIIIALLAQGCSSGYKEFYSQVAPLKYSKTTDVLIFEYDNLSVSEIYNLFFKDYLIIGTSAFVGPYESPKKAKPFAQSIGTNILITSSKFKETVTSIESVSVPSVNTTTVTGYGSGGYFSGTATTTGSDTQTHTVETDRYIQQGMYLRNINSTVGMWEKKLDKFERGEPSSFDGEWENEDYVLELLQGHGKLIIAGFIKISKADSAENKNGLIKLIFDPESKHGVFFSEGGAPKFSSFEVNRFGNLEVKLRENGKVFSFSRR